MRIKATLVANPSIENGQHVIPSRASDGTISALPNPLFQSSRYLELVLISALSRMRAKFIFGKAKFVAVGGQYGENFNESLERVHILS